MNRYCRYLYLTADFIALVGSNGWYRAVANMLYDWMNGGYFCSGLLINYYGLEFIEGITNWLPHSHAS